MSRTEIEKEYTVENGVITSPGKFEGEAVYVPHFWDAFLNGFADFDVGSNGVGFYVTAEDKREFPELKRRRTVKLACRDDGFVIEV